MTNKLVDILVTPFTQSEMRLYAIFNVLFLAALYIFNVITLNPPLPMLKLSCYTLFTMLLAGEYWMVFTRWETFMHMGRPTLFFLIFIEGALVLAIVYLLGHEATIYIFLLIFDAYTAAVFAPRWQAFVLVGVLTAMVGLGYVMLLGWQAGLQTLGGDLFWIVLAVASAEIYVRQWLQREQIEKLHEKLGDAHAQLRDYTQKAEDVAVIRERARLAHEIHDTLGHTLTALDVQLSLCAHLPAEKQAQRDEIIERAGALVRSGLGDLRRAVKALKPAVLETLTLSEALKALIHDFQSKNNLHVSYQMEGEPYSLPQPQALLLYHGATEALTNVLRHAPGAPSVEMRLCFNTAAVSLAVSNASSNNIKIKRTSGDPLQGSGAGLRSLADRVHDQGGHFSAGEDADGAFVLEIELPAI